MRPPGRCPACTDTTLPLEVEDMELLTDKLTNFVLTNLEHDTEKAGAGTIHARRNAAK